MGKRIVSDRGVDKMGENKIAAVDMATEKIPQAT